MNKKIRLLAFLSLSLFSTNAANAQTAIIGITDDDKVFRIADANMPATITTPVAITGLTAGQVVAGSDYRPNTGELYVLGYASAIRKTLSSSVMPIMAVCALAAFCAEKT